MKYSIARGQQGESVLQIDGFQSVCPYSSPLPFQGNMGQVQIIRMPCSTLCPHASLDSEKNNYHVNCANKEQTFLLESKDDPAPKLVSI